MLQFSWNGMVKSYSLDTLANEFGNALPCIYHSWHNVPPRFTNHRVVEYVHWDHYVVGGSQRLYIPNWNWVWILKTLDQIWGMFPSNYWSSLVFPSNYWSSQVFYICCNDQLKLSFSTWDWIYLSYKRSPVYGRNAEKLINSSLLQWTYM